jgi:hypothetical protein
VFHIYDMSVFEIGMLACFGAAWPFSIYRSWRSRTTAGKSIMFLWVVFAGYVCGVLHKLVFSFDRVIFLYALNGLMVFADILLYHRNRRLQRAAAA